ncbi:MAG: EutQ-like cupin domain [Thermoleophilaceae bacterium]|jgi:uncharacterized cupin superfamily protein|nr:EutQ-like cupin domain [Thermoleophilaceae bacterium]
MTTARTTINASQDNGWKPLDWLSYERVEADPDIHTLDVALDEPGVRQAGYATAQPSTFDIVMPHTEILYLIAGSFTVEYEDGTAVTVRAGGSGYFEKGAKLRWTIHEPMKEFFVLLG